MGGVFDALDRVPGIGVPPGGSQVKVPDGLRLLHCQAVLKHLPEQWMVGEPVVVPAERDNEGVGSDQLFQEQLAGAAATERDGQIPV